MSTPAIRADQLTKRYRIGGRRPQRTFRETITNALAAPLLPWTKQKSEEEDVWALKGVSFSVERGEVLGVIGHNGAGKSTLLKILSRITEPSSGRAEIRGRVASLLEVGTGFHPELTGRENVFLNGAILGMTRREVRAKFDEIAAFAEVERFADTPVKHYSSGMYLRLAFAVAAHLEPEILIVDEVLAVGDAGFQRKCLGRMKDVAQSGRTVLLVSHNLAAIEALCNKALLLENGILTAQGRTDSVLANYLPTLRTNTGNAAPAGRYLAKMLVFREDDATGPTDSVQTGDSVRIMTTINVSDRLSGAYIGLGLFDDWGRLLLAMHSKEAGLVIDQPLLGAVEMTVSIPRLFLLPGRFHLKFLIVNRDGEVLEEIPRAASFSVLPRDFSGFGFALRAEHGVILLPFTMTVTCGRHTWTARVPRELQAAPFEEADFL